jgi:hypothetical protein
MAAPAAQVEVIYAKPSAWQSFYRPIVIFFRALRRNKVGFVGFIGLLFYALLITVGPLIVPFDGLVSLDQIAAPPWIAPPTPDARC